MEFSSFTPISIHKSVSASNCKFSELSEDNTSAVRFLYKSVRNFLLAFLFQQKIAGGQQELEMKQDRLTGPKKFCKELFEP